MLTRWGLVAKMWIYLYIYIYIYDWTIGTNAEFLELDPCKNYCINRTLKVRFLYYRIKLLTNCKIFFIKVLLHKSREFWDSIHRSASLCFDYLNCTKLSSFFTIQAEPSRVYKWKVIDHMPVISLMFKSVCHVVHAYTHMDGKSVHQGHCLWYYVSCEEMSVGVSFILGSFLCMRSANERRRYDVTSSLIAWAHTQNDLYIHMDYR